MLPGGRWSGSRLNGGSRRQDAQIPQRAHLAQIPNLTPVPAAQNSLPPDCTMGAPYRVALVPGEPNRTTTPGVGFAWGGLKMPRQWCFHVGCGFSCVHGRTKGRGSQNLGTRNLVPTAEGHPVGVSGRSWAHFDGNWCGLDAGTTKDCARVDPGGRRPQTRGRCEIWRLRMAKSIFRTHRK